MMEIYSVLSRGFVKLSKNLLAFTTHWVANTNKTKYQTFIYLFGVRVFYSLTLRLFEKAQRVKDILVPPKCLLLFQKK